MRRCLWSLSAALLLPATCLAQTLDAATPFIPGEHMTSAAGMPLNDGGLPPGTLTVRVVRGGFAGNLSARDVVLDVLGGTTRTARTNAEGRAEFARVPVGAHVRASVLVDGARLESTVFPMPGDSGVRVLLATGGVSDDAVSAPPDDVPGAVPLETATALMWNSNLRPTTSSTASQAAASRPESGTLMASVLGVSALAFAAVVLIRRSRTSRGW